jgi:hypothetical protein
MRRLVVLALTLKVEALRFSEMSATINRYGEQSEEIVFINFLVSCVLKRFLLSKLRRESVNTFVFSRSQVGQVFSQRLAWLWYLQCHVCAATNVSHSHETAILDSYSFC